ncbi:hypothetical protein HIM_07444 [Hirsutella minnesotensis 3608]|uniref:Insulin-induced gene 2 protein n=1 Tax=Hirsutella minnesotensis 3608 TaxID=1043627 RepID=A0A0F7ZYX8_9HYPO|nr:hypothetical protein HIM_07444 [Hirsutella minnesotensis 3608]
MSDDGPPLIVRPIPRRPFHVDFLSATPPCEDEQDSGDVDSHHGSLASRLRDPLYQQIDTSFLSRPQSTAELTSPALMSIYSPTWSNPQQSDLDAEENPTPWGTRAQSPIRRSGVDETTYELMRDRAQPPSRRLSHNPIDTAAPRSRAASALSLSSRAALLFLLGIGYGVLVTRLHEEQSYLTDLSESIIKPGTKWDYLAFWGGSGVVLGALLPWVDKLWEDRFGAEVCESSDDQKERASPFDGPSGDWVLVMRAIGAFVGIIFAIRKVAWASTLEVSATLALVNPLLWWLIDRSKPGFVLSAAVGLTGSALLLGLNPKIMPAPSGLSMQPSVADSLYNLTTPSPSPSSRSSPLVLGGLATQETIEAGVWMLSVLFCSCICFGNIGRRLAWSKKAGVRGRWGDVR